MKKKSILFFVPMFSGLIILTVVMFSSCKKEQTTDTTTTTETAPVVPPQSSFVMSFDAFPTSAGKMANVDTLVNSYSNAQYAIINVAWWSWVVAWYTAIPTAAFGEALKHQATYVSKGSWKWTYDFTVFVKYTAELHATLVNNNDSVKWEMYISQQNGFQNLLWFYGVSAVNGKSGNWTLNKDSVISGQHTLSSCIYMQWNNNNNGVTDLKYTDIIQNDKGYGSYVKAGALTNSASFNAFYNIYLVDKQKNTTNFTEINWNTTGKNGQVRDTAYFKDSNWHCWDTKTSLLKNTTCK